MAEFNGDDGTPVVPNKEAVIRADEASGTPPQIPAGVRSAIYIITLAVDVLAFVALGILPVLGVLDHGTAGEIAAVIVIALNMLNAGLAVGYRPTRPGSPIG